MPDISITALKEARIRLGDKGLFVVADIANLPFKPGAFDGVVSMHTIHHLPLSEHRRAYLELNRVLKAGRSAVVINVWHNPLRQTRQLLRRFVKKVLRSVLESLEKSFADFDLKGHREISRLLHKIYVLYDKGC